MSRQTIILIGGALTVGKSKIAQLLSDHLKIPWFSTDQIRGIMQATVRKGDYPNIFKSVDTTGEEFLNRYTPAEIVQGEIEQAEEIWKAVKNFIDNPYPWKSFILEGVGILPRFIAKDLKENVSVKPVFLIDEDADRIRDVVFNRGLWDDARTYPDSVKEKEIEWALLFSHELKKEVEQYGYSSVEIQKQDNDLQTVLKALNIEWYVCK